MIHQLKKIYGAILRVFYRFNFSIKLRGIRSRLLREIRVQDAVSAPFDEARFDRYFRPETPTRHLKLSLESEALNFSAVQYWKKYGPNYLNIGNAREKALEHALSLDLFDFTRVHRYCDVATASSPFGQALLAEFKDVEYWKQDLLFKTDLSQRIVGGFAQSMTGISDGFFDAMTLHCAFEHFEEDSDTLFVKECDRLLSDRGACLILPLYLGDEATLFFDPTVAKLERIEKFDPEAKLVATRDYRQEHGRFYSGASLFDRILSRLPVQLKATLVRFEDQAKISKEIYLRHGLILHRVESILRV